MSAFYDIWLNENGTAPEYKRSWNTNWRKEEHNKFWLSLPKQYKQPGFFDVLDTAEHTLIILGQLYEYISTEILLQRCVAFIDTKKRFVDPAGHYILFVIAKTDNSTHVFTNRLGTYHAYYSQEAGANSISTSNIALAKNRKQKILDHEGLTGFLAMGYFPNDKTYLEGVNIFLPASYYRFDSSLKLQQQTRYWNWSYESGNRTLSNTIEELHAILQESLYVSTEVEYAALPVSGGLDSRMLAGALSEHRKDMAKLKALTYGYTDNSKEIVIAKQVANAKNIPVYAYTMPDYLFDKLDEITEAVELFQYVDGTRQASATDWLSKNATVVVGGHWGDVWMNDMKVSDLQTAFRNKVVKKGSQWLLDNVSFAKPEYLHDYFDTFINKYKYIDDPDFRFKIYKTDEWSFRWTTASVRMYQPGAFPVLPFYDNRIVDFFCSVPKAQIDNRRLQIEYIKHYYPELAKIKWQEYDSNLYNYKVFNNRSLVYRAVNKTKRILSGKQTIQRNWEVFYLNPDGKKDLEELLLNNKLLSEIVPEVKTKELLFSLQNNPTAANGYTVSMLLTFALFLNKVMS